MNRALLVALVEAGGLALLGGLLVHDCNGKSAAEREVARLREVKTLASHGAPPVESGTDKDLRKALDEERAKSAALRTALDDAEARVRAATGKPPKIVEVVRWRTKEGTAEGAPREPSTVGSPPSHPPPCLLAPGDSMRIDVIETREETRAGNRLVVGAAKCERLTPTPATLFEAPIELSLTSGLVKSEEKPTDRRWVGGVTASWNGRGWGVGPVVGYFGDRFGLTIGGTFGESSQGVASVLGRL